MQVNVNVSTEILNWIMAHIQMETLPKQIVENLEQWASGNKTPTFRQIEKTSMATGIPIGYFFLKQPPDEDISLVQYRTVDSVALKNLSRNLVDTMHYAEMVQEWTRNYLISEGVSPLPFVGILKNQTVPSLFADSVRKILSIQTDWFQNSRNSDASFRFMRTAISDIGVLVIMNGIVENNTHRPLDINEFRAFAMVDDYAPLIFINSNDSSSGKLFSLLHEFAHICIGENSLFNDRASSDTETKATEALCNAAAAEILVPDSLFIESWSYFSAEMDIEQRVSILARNFRCGATVVARRALDHGFIDYPQYRKIAQLAVKLYNDDRKRKKEQGESGGDYYRTLSSRIDRRFLKMLANSVAEGKTLYTDAFRLTNTNRSTFAALLERGGGDRL